MQSQGGSIDLISDVDIVGKLLIFLGASLVAVSLIEYKKQKNQFRLSKKRLDKFKELSSKKIGDDVNLDNGVLEGMIGMELPSGNTFSSYYVRLNEYSVINEEFQNSNYKCYLYIDDEVTNLTDEVKNVYSIGVKD